MIAVKNTTLDRTLTVRKQVVGPGETIFVDATKNDVKDNLFVQAGMLHVESGGGDAAPSKPSAKEAANEVSAMEDMAELDKYLDDSRKTVATAARERLKALIGECEDVDRVNAFAEHVDDEIANAALERLQAMEE